MDGHVAIAALQRPIKVDDALHEFCLEDADAAEIHEVDGTLVLRALGAHGVVPEMRIAMDDAVFIERHVPGAEHVVGDLVAEFDRRLLLQEGHQRFALDPGHGEEAPGGEVQQRFGEMDFLLSRQHQAIERHGLRLALVIQLLAQSVGDFAVDMLGGDGTVVAFVEPEDEFQLRKVRLDRRLHVGILQLAGKLAPIQRHGVVDLAE